MTAMILHRDPLIIYDGAFQVREASVSWLMSRWTLFRFGWRCVWAAVGGW
jgi:hypothetical protein